MPSIYPLFSGSSGNCTYIENNNQGLLVDAGVSGKRIFEALGESKSKVKALLITHEHSDHISGVSVVARQLKIPVYATEKTWASEKIKGLKEEYINIIEPGEEISVAGMQVTPFLIPHDAAAPVGYNFFDEKEKVTVATDIGQMSEKLFLSLAGSKRILLESNHDIKMLQNGEYPLWLKKRIGGARGHLSNDDAAATCARLIGTGTAEIFLGHLSLENNLPSIAYNMSAAAIEKSGAILGKDVLLKVV